jgi:uncharacterized protein GlcG (DUF336 family)
VDDTLVQLFRRCTPDLIAKVTRRNSQNGTTNAKEIVVNKEITLEVAETMIQAAIKKSEELKIKEDIAVVDASGNLKAFVRMDGAWLGSIDIAIRKARTARYFDMETAEIGKMSQPGQPLYGVELSNGGLISFGGGIPVKYSDGAVIGAVGVSGSSVENDVEVARAAVEACKDRKSATA